MPVLENGNPIALKMPGGANVSLEPGGQIELSGAPLETIHQTCGELTDHLKQVKEVAEDMDISFLGIGYLPKWTLDDIQWMPKGRYKIMREYMPKKGDLGLHMMLATCTVQVNLDYSSEERMVRLFRVALALQPLATALWANSPFREARKTATSLIVVTSGATLIQTEPVCCRLFLRTVSDLRNTWTISWICPCTSFCRDGTYI